MSKTKQVEALTLPLRIKGFSGEHDETGANIVDANGEYVLSTRAARNQTPEEWITYYAIPRLIVTATNHHDELVKALRLLLDIDAVSHPRDYVAAVRWSRELLAKIAEEMGS